jgi:hypothetical protein
MSDSDLVYLIGVIVAFVAFAVTLAVVTHSQHLPPVGTTTSEKSKVVTFKS